MKGKALCMLLAFALPLGLRSHLFAAGPIKMKFANYYHPSHRNAETAAQFCEEMKSGPTAVSRSLTSREELWRPIRRCSRR